MFWTFKFTQILFYVLLINTRNYKMCTCSTNPIQHLKQVIVLFAHQFEAWGVNRRIPTYSCSYWMFHLNHQTCNSLARKAEKERMRKDDSGSSLFPLWLWCNLKVFQAREEKKIFFHYSNSFKTKLILHELLSVLAEKTFSRDDVKKQDWIK